VSHWTDIQVENVVGKEEEILGSRRRAIVLLIHDQQHERSDFGVLVPLVPLSMRGNVDDGIAATLKAYQRARC
jgi:hypothetical protein